MYVSSTSQHRRPWAVHKRICVFRVHLIECICTSCSAQACMIYGLWHANVRFGLVMMSIYDGNSKKTTSKLNIYLPFRVHFSMCSNRVYSSISPQKMLTFSTDFFSLPQEVLTILLYIWLYFILLLFFQHFSIFPLNLFTFSMVAMMSLSCLRWHVFYFLSFSSLIFLSR